MNLEAGHAFGRLLAIDAGLALHRGGCNQDGKSRSRKKSEWEHHGLLRDSEMVKQEKWYFEERRTRMVFFMIGSQLLLQIRHDQPLCIPSFEGFASAGCQLLIIQTSTHAFKQTPTSRQSGFQGQFAASQKNSCVSPFPMSGSRSQLRSWLREGWFRSRNPIWRHDPSPYKSKIKFPIRIQ
jgi:hypothetical protein